MLWLFGGAFSFVLGAVLGSFLNVLVIRMREESSILGRSHCVHCQTPIRPRHLVPIVSWLFLKGRCADCGKRIHFQYPLVEAAGAILALITYVRHPVFADLSQANVFFFELFFVLSLLVLATFDLRWKLLPIEFMSGATVVLALWGYASGMLVWSSVLIGIAVGAGFLGLQVLLSRGKWMGSGDPWMGAMMGAGLGYPGVAVGLYLTYIIGGGVAIVMLASGLVKRGARIPFAPMLTVGTLAALWFGAPVQLWFAEAFHVLLFVR